MIFRCSSPWIKKPMLFISKVCPNTLKVEARIYIGSSMLIVLFRPIESGRVKKRRPEANPKKYIEQKMLMLD